MPTPIGAHSWLPMAYSPQARLVYIPALELEATFDDSGITRANWKRRPRGLGAQRGVAVGDGPQARVVDSPAIEREGTVDDSGITRENGKRTPGAALD